MRWIALGLLVATLPALSRPAMATGRGLAEILPEERWVEIDAAIDTGLRWLATQQQPDGSLEAKDQNQPAVTSFAVMAFLARGHRPGVGPYGELLNRAIDYVLSTRQKWGVLSVNTQGTAVSYNHAIAGLMLGEVYGMTDASRSELVADTIASALKATWSIQLSPKSERDMGGWRYINVSDTDPPYSRDSDLSVTGWHLMFLRSAKNAEFDVPQGSIERALDYVRRCFYKEGDDFGFSYLAGRNRGSNAMTGTGILSLILGGEGDDRMAIAAADSFLARLEANGGTGSSQHYYYAAYYCSQAMAQLGGGYWGGFYPVLVAELSQRQNADGSWGEAEADNPLGSGVGKVYNTSMSVLALTPPYQMLPIFQK
ncbi:terpene cyclase/mutase family protein [soil metagenome]